MKKIILLIVLLLLADVFVFSQFAVSEKVEVQIIYSDIPLHKPLNLELISEESDRDFSYSYPVIDSQDSYTFYDVRPGKYYLGLDFTERMHIMDVLVGFDIDESGNITTSYSVPNEIEVHENRNLKIELRLENGGYSSGFQKHIEEQYNDFDFIGMTFHFATLDPIFDEVNGNVLNTFSDGNVKYFLEKSGSIARSMRVRRTLSWERYHISRKSYMHYFDDCMHCRTGGQSGPDTYNGVDCNYMSIPGLEVYYVLNSFMHAPYGSEEANKFGMGPNRAGANRYTVAVDKKSLKCIALSCLDQKCKCKFECIPTLIVLTDIRYFKCEDLRRVGDKVKTPYLDENNREKIEEYNFYSGEDADCVCNSFERAIIEHELLHCAQYYRKVKEFFQGEVANNILIKVCKKTKKYECKGDVSKCKSNLEKVKRRFRKLISKYFGEDLKALEGEREKEAFDYMFQIFNFLYNKCKSS